MLSVIKSILFVSVFCVVCIYVWIFKGALCSFRNNWLRKHRNFSGIHIVPDIMQSAAQLIKGFRSGKFGPIMLDDLSLDIGKSRQ